MQDDDKAEIDERIDREFQGDDDALLAYSDQISDAQIQRLQEKSVSPAIAANSAARSAVKQEIQYLRTVRSRAAQISAARKENPVESATSRQE